MGPTVATITLVKTSDEIASCRIGMKTQTLIGVNVPDLVAEARKRNCEKSYNYRRAGGKNADPNGWPRRAIPIHVPEADKTASSMIIHHGLALLTAPLEQGLEFG